MKVGKRRTVPLLFLSLAERDGIIFFQKGAGGLGALEWDALCAPTTTTMGVKAL